MERENERDYFVSHSEISVFLLFFACGRSLVSFLESRKKLRLLIFFSFATTIAIWIGAKREREKTLEERGRGIERVCSNVKIKRKEHQQRCKRRKEETCLFVSISLISGGELVKTGGDCPQRFCCDETDPIPIEAFETESEKNIKSMKQLKGLEMKN